MKVDLNPIKDPKFEGAYRLGLASGVLSAVAAATASAGHLFALRWAPVSTERQIWFLLQRFRARLVTIHGPTATQELGLDLSIVRTFTAAGSGGTAVTFAGTPNSGQKRSGMPTSQVADARIANTGALTAGTQTFDGTAIAQASCSEVAFAATVQATYAELNLDTQDLVQYPVVLGKNEGIILRNTIAQGTAYTGRLIVELDWLELERY